MKPIHAQNGPEPNPAGKASPSHTDQLTPASGTYPRVNRRSNAALAQSTYPWLLSASTAIAILFGLMYINKPVIISTSTAEKPAMETSEHPKTDNPAELKDRLLPNQTSLPGEAKVGHPIAAGTQSSQATEPVGPAFEETNLRVQHILTAEAPGGHINRIDIDVPVLYQSRNLHWTANELTQANDLMLRLMDYQEKTRQLKAEGNELLSAWNLLIGQSIPSIHLRADSPSLPENQASSSNASQPVDTSTTEAIQIQLTE